MVGEAEATADSAGLGPSANARGSYSIRSDGRHPNPLRRGGKHSAGDAYALRVDGKSLHAAFDFIVDAIDNPAVIVGYAATDATNCNLPPGAPLAIPGVATGSTAGRSPAGRARGGVRRLSAFLGPRLGAHGAAFGVFPLFSAGMSNICRYFSTSFAPTSSHFYSPFADECSAAGANADWLFEGEVFAMKPPAANGSCSADTAALYRLHNEGQTGAPNHRYTTQSAIRGEMIARGFVPERLGPLGVIDCVPN